MPRPRKCRRISYMPGVNYFKPAGIPLRFLEEVRLTLEEAEAIRLKDIEDLDQVACAERMNISRPTFQRILDSARKKIAEALLNGKAIRIEGGNFEMTPLIYMCENGHQWEVPLEKATTEPVQVCPICGTSATRTLQMNMINWGRHRHGWCNR